MSGFLDKFISVRAQYGLVVLACIAAVYLSGNFVFGRVVTGFTGNYVLPSIAWVALALGVIYLLPRGRPEARGRHRKLFCWVAFLSAAALILALYAAGLLDGLGRSPYDHSFRGILINIFYLGSMIIGMEISRAWLINYLFKKRPVLGIGLVTLIFTMFAFSPGRLLGFETMLDGAEFAGNTFLPAFSESMLTTYLAFLGGALPAIIYQGTLHAYQWFSPVLPDLNWIMHALIGTFVPVFSMVMVHQLHRSEVQRIRSREKESPVGWVASSALSVVMIWFAVGVFSIYPNVIVSGSMEPEISIGDIVIVRSIEPEQVEEGDVIQFREIEQDIRINHRVIEIEEDERGKPLFTTKGDANQSPDSDPVLAEQVMGRVEHVVPGVGWVTIMLRSPASEG